MLIIINLVTVFQNTHMEYVVAAATLYGQIYGIKGTRDSVREILENVDVPVFTPKSSVKIHLTDKEMQDDKAKESDDAGEFLPTLLLFICYYLTLFHNVLYLLPLCICTRKSST